MPLSTYTLIVAAVVYLVVLVPLLVRAARLLLQDPGEHANADIDTPTSLED